MTSDAPVLKLKNIYKSFGGVKALQGVDFTLYPGEVHAIVGENGAGKSTLMNIIGGNLKPDAGEIIFNSKVVMFNSPKEAMANHITFIHQELSVFPELNVVSNIFIEEYAGKRNFNLLHKRKYYNKAKEILNKINLDIDPNTSLATLGMGQRQMVEISRVYTHDTHILVLDEPTSSLTDTEIEILFELVKSLVKRGVAIIYISHKLEEVFKISDRITVLRDGLCIGTYHTNDLDSKTLIELMIGNKMMQRFPLRQHKVGNETILKVEKFSREKAFSNISFELHKSEVLGIVGLLGAGRTEVARALFGLDKKQSGNIYIKGRKVNIKSSSSAIRQGIGFITEDRRKEGLIIERTIQDNVSLASLYELSRCKYLFNHKKQRIKSEEMVERTGIKATSVLQLCKNLSGGNQQKVVIAKWLLKNPDILIMDEPTRGIDVGAKYEIYKLIDQLACMGKSIIFISSEIPEIMGVCDNILVMRKGEITTQVTTSKVEQKDLMYELQKEGKNDEQQSSGC